MLTYFVVLCITSVRSLVGYKCGKRPANIIWISLIPMGNYDFWSKEMKTVEVYVQLLQLSDYDYVDIKQCKVEISRIIYCCSMHSDVSVRQNRMNE